MPAGADPPRRPCGTPPAGHIARATRERRTPGTLPLMAVQLMLSSWEVIARRSLLMTQRWRSPLEYQRTMTEKVLLYARVSLDPEARCSLPHRTCIRNE